MSEEKLIEAIESGKEKNGIVSYELKTRSLNFVTKKGYQGLANMFLNELMREYPDLVGGGHTVPED